MQADTHRETSLEWSNSGILRGIEKFANSRKLWNFIKFRSQLTRNLWNAKLWNRWSTKEIFDFFILWNSSIPFQASCRTISCVCAQGASWPRWSLWRTCSRGPRCCRWPSWRSWRWRPAFSKRCGGRSCRQNRTRRCCFYFPRKDALYINQLLSTSFVLRPANFLPQRVLSRGKKPTSMLRMFSWNFFSPEGSGVGLNCRLLSETYFTSAVIPRV